MLHQTNNNVYEIVNDNLGNVALSNVQKHQDITLTNKQLTAKYGQGYRTVLGTHGITSGTYYYECYYEWPENVTQNDMRCPREFHPQVRVGFSTQKATLDGPVGFDYDSVAIRSVDGTICTNRKRLESNETYGVTVLNKTTIPPNSIIGCLIHIPEDFEPENPLSDEQELCLDKHTYVPLLQRLRVSANELHSQQEHNSNIEEQKSVTDSHISQRIISNTQNQETSTQTNLLASSSTQTIFVEQGATDLQEQLIPDNQNKQLIQPGIDKYQSQDNNLKTQKQIEMSIKLSKQNRKVTVPGSYIQFYLNGTCIGRKVGLAYNRWYPAISGYNYAKITVNFGARNTRRSGYPAAFYCLPGCLIDPFQVESIDDALLKNQQLLQDDQNKLESLANQDPDKIQSNEITSRRNSYNKKYQYACVPLDIQKIIEKSLQNTNQSEQKPIELIKQEKTEVSQEQGYQSYDLQNSHASTLGKEEGSASTLNTGSTITTSSIVMQNSLNYNLSIAYSHITESDLIRTQMNKQELKDFIRKVYRLTFNQESSSESNESKINADPPKNKGFKYLPFPDAKPFSQLYLERSRREYMYTDQALQEGLYNKYFHTIMDHIYGEKQRKVKH